MKATDLMIGDWVNVTGEENCLPSEILKLLPKIGRVVGLDGDTIYVDFVDFGFMLGDIRPIPLTPEILEKNGWKTTDRYRYNRGGVWFDIINRGAEDFDIEVSAYDGGFAYVATIYNIHELQHALRLCGIEKEIEL